MGMFGAFARYVVAFIMVKFYEWLFRPMLVAYLSSQGIMGWSYMFYDGIVYIVIFVASYMMSQYVALRFIKVIAG